MYSMTSYENILLYNYCILMLQLNYFAKFEQKIQNPKIPELEIFKKKLKGETEKNDNFACIIVFNVKMNQILK